MNNIFSNNGRPLFQKPSLDRFLIADNPMNPKSGGTAIIHTIDPMAIIEVVHDEVKSENQHETFDYQVSEDVTEKVTLIVNFAYFKYPDSTAVEREQLLKKAWRWYRSYLEWQDKNIDTDERSVNN